MQKFLIACRYLLLIPVVGCLTMTAIVLVMGLGRVFGGVAGLIRDRSFSETAAKEASLAVIEIIDLFLVGTVAYITAVGLFKLFVADTKTEFPMRLRIEKLKDLEDKIIGVVIAALAVAFLGEVVKSTDTAGLLEYGGGVALVIAALTFFMKSGPGEK